MVVYRPKSMNRSVAATAVESLNQSNLKVTLVTNLLSASGRPAPLPVSLDRPGRLV